MELQAHVEMESWLRIVAAAVFFYDFLITIPSEIRLYRRQEGHPSLACVFFILARYVGLAAVISATIVFFHGFDLSTCSKLIIIVGLTRSMLSTVVNMILLGRTWVIWGRARWIIILMGAALIPCTVLSYGYLFEQHPIVKAGACTALSGKTLLGQKWLFALVNMLYDVIACLLCTYRLVRNVRAEKAVSGISRILLSDGIGYFIIVMIGHALNLSFLRSPDSGKQGSFLTFNVALSSILSQKIITSLYERTSLKGASNTAVPSRSKGVTGVNSGIPPSPFTPNSPWSRSPHSPRAFSFKQDYQNDGIELNENNQAISIGVHVETHVEAEKGASLHPYAAAV